ncbi:MAG: GNAT family N-acetyltransferase [Chitinophagaceae bacterium]
MNESLNEYPVSVRELLQSDIELIANYWLGADKLFLTKMGVDTTKIPALDGWNKMLTEQLAQINSEKKSYCIIWVLNNIPVGHSNINKIVVGEEAFMHLHLWKDSTRRKGMGMSFVRMTLPYFFENYNLKNLYCEPYALNPAPNRTLKKIGFEFEKEYITTPGWLNFEQPVQRWVLSYEKYISLFNK